MEHNFNTDQKITWCPGCLNSVVLLAFKKALAELTNEGLINPNKIVLVTDIGCGGKIYDFVNVNGFYALHGRVIPTGMGIKLANSDLKVIGFAGDGATYNEGLSHFLHASRRNVDMTMIVADNRVFALTKGQPTATNELDHDMPLNPLVLADEAGATFIARGTAFDLIYLTELIKKAILHKGFSIVDILEPCMIFHNDSDHLKNHFCKTDHNEICDDGETISFDNSKEIKVGVFKDELRPVWGDKKSAI